MKKKTIKFSAKGIQRKITLCVWSFIFLVTMTTFHSSVPIFLVYWRSRAQYAMEPLKLIVVGPAGAGKTTIANFIADATDISYDYRPTKGVRILELEVPNVRVKNKTIKVDVELWDCSGDRKYENYWPAFRKDALGIILVCAEKSNEHTRELEQLYDYFVNQPNLEAKSCVIFHHDPEKIRSNEFFNNSSSSTLARISQVTCNVEDGGLKLKSDFQAFVSSLTTRKQERSEQEESTIISDTSWTNLAPLARNHSNNNNNDNNYNNNNNPELPDEV